MKQNSNTLRGFTLLAAGVIVCLGTAPVHAQRVGQVPNRASGGRATSNRATTGTTTTGSTGSSTQSSNCPQNSTSQTGSTSTSSPSSSSTSTTTQSGTVNSNAVSSQIGMVSAQHSASNRLLVQWSGNTNNVSTVYIGVLDVNGRVLSQQALTQLPVQASLTLTTAARYYGVQVVFSNGTSKTVYSKIP